jgi:hypothetical protein
MYPKVIRKARFAAILVGIGALFPATAGIGALFPATAWANEVTSSPLIFQNWTVSGSLTDKKSDQAITLPSGSTFNGGGELLLELTEKGTLANISGTVEGSIFVPEFSSPLTLAGTSTPVSTELSFQEVDGPSQGTITKDPTSKEAGAVVLNVVSKANLGLTEIGLLGIDTPVNCVTSEPVTFDLLEHTTINEMVNVGPRFTGTVTLPSFTCGGLQGAVVGPVVSAALSGPENPYSIGLSPPA